MKPQLKTKNLKCPFCNFAGYQYLYNEENHCQYGYCERCGYLIDQEYTSIILTGFYPPRRRGIRGYRSGKYYSKNIRKRMRMKKKLGIKYTNKDMEMPPYVYGWDS